MHRSRLPAAALLALALLARSASADPQSLTGAYSAYEQQAIRDAEAELGAQLDTNGCDLMSNSNTRLQAESAALIGSVSAFLLFFVAAARAYSGGTHFDHASVGHDFWRNTLCDIARTVSLDGAPNACACTLARIAMVTLALGLGVLFVSLPRLFPSRPRLGTAVRGLGLATVPCAIAVVLLPTDRFSQLHGVAIVLAGMLGLGTVILALVGLFSDARAPGVVVALGTLALSVAAVDFGLYVAEFLSGGPAQIAVPVLERVTTILLLAWMVAVARAVHRLRVQSLARKTVQMRDRVNADRTLSAFTTRLRARDGRRG